MYKKLRIACTVIATLFLVAIVPAGSIFDFMGFAVCGVGAGLFFVLMLYFKQSQLFQEEKKAKSNQTSSSADETPIDETSINETSINETSIDEDNENNENSERDECDENNENERENNA